MTISLHPSTDTLSVEIVGAHDLNGAAVELRLPSGCTYERLRPGDLLEQSATPLAVAGPRPDGSILAASVLPRGSSPVSGDGVLFALATKGATCVDTPTLLRATAYAADGSTEQLPTELPSSGPDGVSGLAVIAGLIAWGMTRR